MTTGSDHVHGSDGVVVYAVHSEAAEPFTEHSIVMM
jgi:hypothetical protein